MFSKTWRVHLIFMNKKLKRKVGMRFTTARSPRIWVSGHCTKWKFKAIFIACLHSSLRFSKETHYLASILNKFCIRKRGLALEVTCWMYFHRVAWRRTLTNGCDVKFIFVSGVTHTVPVVLLRLELGFRFTDHFSSRSPVVCRCFFRLSRTVICWAWSCYLSSLTSSTWSRGKS